MTTIWNNNNSYGTESKATEISEKTGYSDPECMLCGRVMHNSFEQNDDKEAIKNALTRHYEEYHPENLDHIDIELKKQLAKTGRDMGGGSNSQEGNMNKEAYTWFKSLSKNEQIELLDGQQYGSKGSFNDIENEEIGLGGELDLLIENIYYSKFLGKDPQAISYGDKNEYPIDDDKDPDQEDRAKIRTAFRGSRYGNTGYSHQNESNANEVNEEFSEDAYLQMINDSYDVPMEFHGRFYNSAEEWKEHDPIAFNESYLAWIDGNEKDGVDTGHDDYTTEDFDSYNLGNPTDDLKKPTSADDRIADTQESGQVDKDPNWKSGRFRRGGSWSDKKDEWDKSQKGEMLQRIADGSDVENEFGPAVDELEAVATNYDLPDDVNNRVEKAIEIGCDQCDGSGFIHDEGGRTKEERSACKNCDGKGFVDRGGLFKEVKGDYVVYDGEDYSVEDTTRNELEPTEDRAGKLMRDQKATSNFWEDNQKTKVPQGQGHKWQKHGEQDDRPEDSHVTVDLSDNKKTHDDLDDEFWKGIRESKSQDQLDKEMDERLERRGFKESKGSEIFEDLEEVTELDDSEKDEVFEFLFDLRESGKTNMFGAGSYVQEEFGFDKKLTDNIVQEWMKNYKEISRRMGRESRTSSLYDGDEESDTEINPMSDSEKDEIFQYLFELQSSGVTNMFGAVPYAVEEFPDLDKKEVKAVVMEWMKNYSEIHDRMGIDFV